MSTAQPDYHSHKQVSLQDIESYIAQARDMIKPLWKFETERWIRGMCIADINRDDNLEIAIAAQDKTLRVLNASDGEIVWQAPVEQPLFSVFVADVDRDGDMEVIAGAGESPQSIELEATDAHLGDEFRSGAIYVFSENGHFECEFAQDDKVRGLAAADINHDNAVEIIMGLENNQVVAVNRNGNSLWSNTTGEWVYVIHLADIDADDNLEIIAGSGDGHVYVYNNNGQLLWRFRTGERLYSIDTGDVDDDGQIEVVVGSGDRNVYIIGQDGVLKTNFLANERVRNVAVADCDHDGQLEIIGGLGDKHVYIWKSDGELLWRFKASDGVIRSLKTHILPNGNILLVVGGEECVVRAYEINIDLDVCRNLFLCIGNYPGMKKTS